MSSSISQHLPSSPALKKPKLSSNSANTMTQTVEHAHLTHAIVGLGNPLLDISADVDHAFLDKYALKLDNAILADETHLPLYEEITTVYKPVFVAGGATQNSIRVAQWMLNKHNAKATSFFGSVGKDEHGKILRECAERDGVNAHYLEKEDVATGTCAVCIVDTERSMVANLSAANHFHHDHLESDVSKDLISKGKYFYSAGFHLTVSPQAVMKLAEHAHENNKIFMLNLAAPFIVQFFKDPLMAAMPYADFVFGNESEAKEFGIAHGWGEDIKTIALKTAQLPKNSGARSRTVVFTQGANPTIAVYQGEVYEFAVPALTASEIIDTNGAGDAFVGGFVSRLSLGKPLEDCVTAGHWAAQVVLRRSGCTFPAECEYTD
ncbi:Adenosine kinase, partial [Globisporangium splendens]